MRFDEKRVRQTVAILKADQLFEVRIKFKDKALYSGYFDDADTLVEELKKLPNTENNAYITLNGINTACKARSQYGKFLKKTDSTTSDNDIIAYEWMLVDLDPKRPADTSSTDEQVKLAKEKAIKVYEFLNQVGFEKPVLALSGNGYHLLYKIGLINNADNKELIKTCLQVLDMYLTDETIAVDTSVFNPARICKLYGTIAQKGNHSEEYPHRMSGIIGEYAEIKQTDVKYLKKLADMMPKEEKPQRYNNYNAKEFNIEQWMDKFGLRYKTSSFTGGTKYILDCCPFNSNHKGKDACIFRRNDSSLAFHCFHNECADKGWKDVRLLFEPNAYEKRDQEFQKQAYHSFNRNKAKESKPIVEEENKPVFMTMQNIMDIPKKAESFVKTGYAGIDMKIRGLKKGYTSVWSGLRGSAKSTVLSQLALDAMDVGNNVGFYSGELAPKNFARWMMLQAAGKNRVEPSCYEGYYNVSDASQKKISEWMADKFWLYNNDYGNDAKAILEQFEKTIVDKKLDLLILDNLMAFDISTLNENKWDAQKDMVWKIHELAQKYDVAICLVAHPRKSMGFLRLDDIAGTSDIANTVEYAFIVHRVNNDFKRLSAQMFGFKDDNPIYEATNVIEICKDRDGGTQDVFIPLWYENESKRLKSTETENKIYGWDNNEWHDSGLMELEPEDEDSIPF